MPRVRRASQPMSMVASTVTGAAMRVIMPGVRAMWMLISPPMRGLESTASPVGMGLGAGTALRASCMERRTWGRMVWRVGFFGRVVIWWLLAHLDLSVRLYDYSQADQGK